MLNTSNTPSQLANTTRFPYRLHKMLEEASHIGRDDLITWLPCGTKFRLSTKYDAFEAFILSKFCRVPKYKSFLRSLSMYKFQRVGSGPAKGAYFHPHFVRNRLDLAEYINRQRIEEIPASKLQPATTTPPAAVVIPMESSTAAPTSMPTMFQNNKNNESFENLMDQSFNGTVVSLEEEKSWNQKTQVDLVTSTTTQIYCQSSLLAPHSKDIVNEIINTFCIVETPKPVNEDMDNLSLSLSVDGGDDFGSDDLLPFERLDDLAATAV